MKFLNPVSSKNYQPHIDGLRALAIIPVFLYHLNPAYCSGGFGGVDVFFVISGYLISLGILKNLDRGTFSLLDFYDKRIRRIIPIYTFTILAVLFIAPFIFYPEKLYDLAKMAVSGTFFVANIDLYLSQSYWTQGELPSPLTNLWSLSVEEQFYVFLPILLILIHKFARKYLLPILGLVFLASFSLILYHFFTNLCVDFAFYMLPFRMYELLMGTFLAYFTLRNTAPQANLSPLKNKLYTFVSMLALVALVCVYYSLNSTYLFPSLWAFALCAIAVILIKFGSFGLVGKFLSSAPLVFIGRISYSVYLIHYPLIIFWTFITYDRLSVFDEIIITLLTIAISTLTWAFVELPIRLSKTWNRKKSYILFFITILIILFVASSYYITSAFYRYIPISPYKDIPISIYEDIDDFQSKNLAYKNIKKVNFIEKINKIDVYRLSNVDTNVDTLVVGDSHSTVLYTSLVEEFSKRNMGGVLIAKHGSFYEYAKYYKSNSSYINTVLEYIDTHKNIKNIIIINKWTYSIIGKTNRAKLFDPYDEKGYVKFIKELKSRNMDIFVTSSVPEPLFNLNEYRYKKEVFPANFETRLPKKQYQAEVFEMNRIFNSLVAQNLIKTIRLEPLFDDGDYYKFQLDESTYLFFDDDHLSEAGARIVAPYLVEEYLRLKAESNGIKSDSAN